MSTIDGTTVNQGVTLGTAGNYVSPLTITTTGAVSASADNGIYGPFALANQTVVNQGTVMAQKTGVRLMNGGSVNNSGLIAGGTAGNTYSGVYIRTNGTITNTGTILGGGSENGVRLSHGGILNNNAGLIQAYDGVYVNYSNAGTVTNAGTIVGTGGANGFGVQFASSLGINTLVNSGSIASGRGVFASGAAIVTNNGVITGTRLRGVELAAGGTVINAGVITGGTLIGNATAVSFGGAGTNRLVLENGFQFNGAVVGSDSATNTVELEGGAGAVTFDFNGLSLVNFGTITFGTASVSQEIIAISNTAALPGTIAAFTQLNEIVDLTQLNPINAQATLNGTQLTVSNGSQVVTLNLDAEDYTGITWSTAADSGAGTNVFVACFCRGTLILTDRGETAVESLSIGDHVVTLSGEARPIKWIGRRAYDPRFIRGDKAVLPICIAAGALGEGVPVRDLGVSPEHALFIDGVLVAARLLVNGTTITQAPSVEILEYFHIELAAHDVLLAEGAPAESYVERHNRGMFHNVAEYAALYPDNHDELAFCAPRLDAEAAELVAIRRRLTARAMQRDAVDLLVA